MKRVSDKDLQAFNERIEAMSRPHCELEKDHYQALKNPTYQIEGMMDVIREELHMANAPSYWYWWDNEISFKETEYPPVARTEITRKVITLEGKQIGELQRELVSYIQRKINSMIERKSTSRKKYTSYKT